MTLPNLLAFTQDDARKTTTSRLLRLMDGGVVEEVLRALDPSMMDADGHVWSGNEFRSKIEHVQTLAKDEIDRRIPIPDPTPRPPAWAIDRSESGR